MQEFRSERKVDHIENYLRSFTKNDPLFKDIYIEHVALNDIDFENIDTSVEFLGKKLDFPLMIDAMTGGNDVSTDINQDLSNICLEFNLPMAVGSQTIALKDPESEYSFKVVYEESGGRFPIIGNLGANSTADDFKKACDLINAQAMQVHLNTAQELVMPEGDRNFKNYLKNIQNIRANFDKELIVKEVGFGIDKKSAQKLHDIGIRYIDIAGLGGTNFIEIEDMRNFDNDFSDLYGWGIPSAKSIIDVRSVSDDFFIIASGGIKSCLDIVKSIVIGADMCAMSGEVLSYLLRGGYDHTVKFIEQLQYKTKCVMALLGVDSIEKLKKVDYKVTGRLKELLD